MAKTATATKREIRIDLKSLQSTVQNEAQRGFHAGVGVADLAVSTVVGYVTGAQKRLDAVQKDTQDQLSKAQRNLRDVELQPRALRRQATHVVSARVEDLNKEAKARRDAIEKRVVELQNEAQKFIDDNVEQATETYDDLVKRGETVLRRFRNQPETKQAVRNAKTTKAKAKSTVTQARHTAEKASATVDKAADSVDKTVGEAGDKVEKTVKKASGSVEKTVRKSPARSSAKATKTAAKKTATSAKKAVSAAASASSAR